MNATPLSGKILFGPFELDPASGELRKQGRKVRVPEQAFQILCMLVERPAEIVAREEIRRRLWPNGTLVEFEHSINAAIKKLRLALGDSAEKPRYVETIPRRGYRLIVPIEHQGLNSPSALHAGQAFTSEVRAGNLSGRRILHYRILNIIGGGAMGVVYEAEDLKLNRRVALKFLPDELTRDSLAVERLQREARAASGLTHPNICTVHAIEEEGGHSFIAMELLKGCTLRDRIARGPLSVQETVQFGLQMAEALETAHTKGIIHRDIKPANVFIGDGGEIKILDFGVAKVVWQSDRPELENQVSDANGLAAERPGQFNLTKTGVTVGTAAYMSPEQIRGERLDCRTDLFSFGLVLYEMATGQQAFEQATVSQLHDAILNRTPVPVRQLMPQTPGALVQIINKALEKGRGLRYQSAGQIRQDLIRLSNDRGWNRGSIGIARRGWFAQSRRRFVVLCAVFAVLAIITAFALYRGTSGDAGFSPENVRITRLTDSGRALNAAISPDGRYVVYALENGGDSVLRLRTLATRKDTEILPSDAVYFEGMTFSPDVKDIYFVRSDKNDPGIKYLYRMTLFGGSPKLLIRDIDSAVSFSPDGRRFVFTRGIPTRNSMEVRIANSDGTGEHLLAALPHCFAGYQTGATWSRDGQTIAVPAQLLTGQVSFALDFISVPGGQVREVYSSGYSIGRALWLPHRGSLLVPLGEQGGKAQLWTLTYPGGRARRVTNDLSAYDARGVDLTRDGKTLAVVAGNLRANVWVMNGTEASQARQITTGELPIVEAHDFGLERLMGVSNDGAAWLINRETGQRTPFLEGMNLSGISMCGGSLVFASFERATETLFRADTRGGHLVKLASGNFTDPTCSLDGDFFYFVKIGTPQKIDRASLNGGALREIAPIPGDGSIGGVQISRDGNLLAYAYEQFSPVPTLRFAIISANGAWVKSLQAPAGFYGVSSIRWSPDGKNLQFHLTQKEADNIWEQPLAGGPAKQLTNFSSDQIFDFDWSRDGKELLLTRGEATNDVILLSRLQ